MTKETSICERISPPNRITVNSPIINTESTNVGASYQVPPPEIPENHFLKWLHDKMVNEDIVINLGYKDCKYITEFIRSEEASQWTANTPVFISSQTGSGKTTFVYDVLIKDIILKSQAPNDKVLLLCNRVALSRQCKYKAAEWQKNFRKNSSYEKMLAKHQVRGIDEDCPDFGAVHIYTYHQIYHKILREKSNNEGFSLNNYKYIVFDECHFFTSDSRFLNTTDDMLKVILEGANQSVRIYMSATPDVAFEAIIRMEFACMDEIRNKYINDVKKIFSDCRNGKHILTTKLMRFLGCIFDYSIGNFTRIPMTSESYRELLEEYASPTSARGIALKFSTDSDNKDLQLWEDSYCNQIKSDYKLNIYFYYMERNYDYIKNIKIFKDVKELVREINEGKSPKNKWMVFVHSRKYGKKICDSLNETNSVSENESNDNTKTDLELEEMINDLDANIDSVVNSQEPELAVFISAENKNTELKASQALDDIVKNEQFEQNILITTSVLDNGINIKDSNIHNIAIDIYDRIEFLQMLGRLRIENENHSVNLYVKEYNIESLKSYAHTAATNLLHRLEIDMHGSGSRKEIYKQASKNSNPKVDIDLYRFSDDTDIFCTYNTCSIYQLIDSLNNLITIIRETDKDFCICFKNDELELLRKRQTI